MLARLTMRSLRVLTWSFVCCLRSCRYYRRKIWCGPDSLVGLSTSRPMPGRRRLPWRATEPAVAPRRSSAALGVHRHSRVPPALLSMSAPRDSGFHGIGARGAVRRPRDRTYPAAFAPSPVTKESSGILKVTVGTTAPPNANDPPLRSACSGSSVASRSRVICGGGAEWASRNRSTNSASIARRHS
jgi:hypothetical protein